MTKGTQVTVEKRSELDSIPAGTSATVIKAVGAFVIIRVGDEVRGCVRDGVQPKYVPLSEGE